ncbi:MAG: flagellar biosynthetic protein FliR [Treponema sp.]|nr:flagellar biosynthetic protein FliR [Candidatus Treponema caballi]
MLDYLVSQAPLFLLVAVRVFAILQTTPLLSTASVPRIAKLGLTGCIAYFLVPMAYNQGYRVDPYSLDYIALLLGEGLIGVITGFFINMIFGAFSSAGQFFSLQMGFSAAEAYDALSQVENPLMGQYLNFLAMLAFLQTKGFQKLLLSGVFRSFQSLNAMVLLQAREEFMNFLLKGLTQLFFDAMLISFPMIATLFLVSVSMGILSKAAPQMNLLSEGLPITILVSFFLLWELMPTMIDYFSRLFDASFTSLEQLFLKVAPHVN